MSQIDKNLEIARTNELSHLLNELSFSYIAVYSSQQALKDLDVSIKELRGLIDCLQAEYER